MRVAGRIGKLVSFIVSIHLVVFIQYNAIIFKFFAKCERRIPMDERILESELKKTEFHSLWKGEKPDSHFDLVAKIQSGEVDLRHDSRHHSGTDCHTTGKSVFWANIYQRLTSNLILSGFKVWFHLYVLCWSFKMENVMTQGIAYAIVAGLPPQYGLYSAYLGCFVYCLLGRWWP